MPLVVHESFLNDWFLAQKAALVMVLPVPWGAWMSERGHWRACFTAYTCDLFWYW